MNRFLQAILKKLANYAAKLNKELENARFFPLLENLDIKKI